METVQLFELDTPFRGSLVAVDLAVARRAFASLMDRALPEIQARRLDQDEVLLERYVEVSDQSGSGGAEIVFPLAAMVEEADWVRSFDAYRSSTGMAWRAPVDFEILTLRLRVVREASVPIVDPFGSESSDA